MRRARSRASRVWLCAGVAAATVAAGVEAGAGPDEEPIRLAYQAGDGCPTEADFVARIRARTTRARVAWPGENARMFDVRVDAGPPASGRVMILDVDLPAGTRHVEADTCADVTDALALVIALSIDPRASNPSPASSPPVDAPPPPAPRPDPVEQTPRAGPASERVTEPPSPPSPPAMLAGADFVVAYGVTPNPLMSGSPYLGWRSNAAGFFAPSVRLALVYATADTDPGPMGSAHFAWTVGRLDVCPTDWVRSRFLVTTCARLESGVLAVAAHDVGAPETRVRPWFAAGVLARAEWSFLPPVFLDADIDLLVRATNDRFYFLPDTTVYRVPVLGASGGIGLGAHFL